ncbi:MAG: hypothetical protein Q4G25_07170 [Paracoccus sp. (in: a-proteobacteria)]|nr:hypothetical protein [Paracoccus sp. (in: a-proteobacteria)]
MKTALRAILIGLLVLTSQGLAAARGQPRVMTEHVICGGGGIATILLDERGEPVSRTVLCPDLALLMMSAVDMAPVQPLRSDAALSLSVPQPETCRTGRDAPAAQARGPPSMIA